jgi:NADPH:quinone reductase-like Zn-dependent oxidoreductase
MLVSRARVQEGENVLIHGIGGGVALASLGVARMLGARTWVTSTSDAKLEKAKELGAEHALNSTRDDIPRVVRERTQKRGIDVVIDCVGEATWRTSLAVLGKRGRLVTCGGTSGPLVQTDLRRVFWNHQSILGSTMGNDADFDAVVGHYRQGRLRPVVDSIHSLEEGRAAFARLASREHFGKVVVTI